MAYYLQNLLMESVQTVWYHLQICATGVATWWWKKFQDMFVRFDMIHERDRRTDRQTDRRKNRETPHDSIDWACIASRGKNASQHVLVYLQQFPSYSNHNCKKSPFLRNPAFIFCLPWGRPCGNHAKRCMNVKTIQCLPNSLQHVPIYSIVSELCDA